MRCCRGTAHEPEDRHQEPGLQRHRQLAAEGQDRLLLVAGAGHHVRGVDAADQRQARRTGRPGIEGSRVAHRVHQAAGTRGEPGAAEAAAGADGAGAAADAAAAAEQDRNARPDHRHLADRAVQRPDQRAVRAGAGADQGVLRRKADQAAHGGQLPPVRRVRQWRGLAAAGGDPDHA
uniref:Uncharacterized protein n=1 Tax=Panagrolaimus superbus TaxID=310955 RepID=A0A914YH49_9BILA